MGKIKAKGQFHQIKNEDTGVSSTDSQDYTDHTVGWSQAWHTHFLSYRLQILHGSLYGYSEQITKVKKYKKYISTHNSAIF